MKPRHQVPGSTTTIDFIASGNARRYRLFVSVPHAPPPPAGYPVLVGSQVSIGKDQDDDTVSFISPGGAGSLHILQGIGL